MAINDIFVSNAQALPGQSITPAGSPQGQPPTTQAPEQDRVRVSSAGGNQEIRDYTIDAASGDDTVTLNGSPVGNSVDLGLGADLFQIDTLDLGGSLTASTVVGGLGNDTLQILVDGAGVNTTFIDTDAGDGTVGSDLIELRGSFSRNVILTRGGNDVIRMLAPGNDGFNNFSRNEVLLGAGQDLFTDGGFPLTAFASTIGGGAGRDTIILLNSTTGAGDNGTSIRGGDAADLIYGTASGENTVQAGAGFDFVQTFADNDDVFGGGGSDTILLGRGQDFADAQDGNDVVFGEAGDDTVEAGTGRDIVLGGLGEDLINGGEGDFQDLLAGEAGDDTIDGGSGGDLIYGDELGAGSAAGFILGTQARIVSGVSSNGTALTGTTNILNGANRPGPTLGQISNYTNGFTGGLAAAGQVIWDQTASGSTDVTNKTNTQANQPPFSGNTDVENGVILANDAGGLLLNVVDEIALANNLAAPGTSVTGAFGNDIFAFNDQLSGNSGNDTIFGGGGSDVIDGGLNNDIIAGGFDADVMSGDDGSDIFVQGINASNAVATGTRTTNWTFNWTLNNGPDIITDFTATTNAGQVVDQVAFDVAGNFATANAFVGAGTGFNVVNATGSADAIWAANDVVVFRGTWFAATNQFSTSNNGADALVFKADAPVGLGTTNLVGNAAALGTQAVVLTGAGDENFIGGNFFGTFV